MSTILCGRLFHSIKAQNFWRRYIGKTIVIKQASVYDVILDIDSDLITKTISTEEIHHRAINKFYILFQGQIYTKARFEYNWKLSNIQFWKDA